MLSSEPFLFNSTFNVCLLGILGGPLGDKHLEVPSHKELTRHECGEFRISGTPSDISRPFESRKVQEYGDGECTMNSCSWKLKLDSVGQLGGSDDAKPWWGLSFLDSRSLRTLSDQSQKSNGVCLYCNVFPVDFLSSDIVASTWTD